MDERQTRGWKKLEAALAKRGLKSSTEQDKKKSQAKHQKKGKK